MTACHSTGASYQPILPLLSAVLAGVSADRLLDIPLAAWPLSALLALGFWSGLSRHVMKPAACLVLLAAFGTGGCWHHLRWRIFPQDELGLAASVQPMPFCAEAIARSSPRWTPAGPRDPMDTIQSAEVSQFAIEVVAVKDGSRWRTASGQALVRVEGSVSQFGAGDRLRLVGLISQPEPPLNPGEPDFALYERSERRLFRVELESPECLQVLRRGSRWQISYWLNQVRDRCSARLWRHLSPERAGLAAAVLLGTREQLDRRRTEDYMATGTVHLLSISGLHVGILAYAFWLLTRLGWLSRKTTLCAAIVFVVLYALLTDARPPVVRASVLIVAICVARLLGRQPFNVNTLCAAGLVVVAVNPSSFFQVGTQLSFLAVATMAGIPSLLPPPRESDPLDELMQRNRPWLFRVAKKSGASMFNGVLLSTLIWVVSLPLVVFRFHLVSPIATVLNPIVCWPMGLALFAGVAVMLLGDVAPPIAAVCGFVCDQSLAWMEWLIVKAVAIPGAYCWLPAPPRWWVMTFYATAATVSLFARLRPARRWLAAISCVWLALGGWLTAGPTARDSLTAPDTLTCTFVAVGHGTSVCLEFPTGRTLLYDAGRMGISATGARAISSVLWERRIKHLDAVVISHADADHFNALPALLKRFSVARVYVSPVMFRHRSAILTELRRSIDSYNIPVVNLAHWEELQVGDDRTRVWVLHPPPGGTNGSDNSNSIVLLIEHAGQRLLLPGDIEPPGLDQLLALPPLGAGVAMAPHHGSAGSHPAAFVQWCQPQYVVISGGANRVQPQVIRTLEASGARVLYTARDGAVTVRMNQQGCRVETYRR